MGIGALGTEAVAIGQELYSSSATPAHAPGTKGVDGLGGVYRYAKAGAVTLVTGNALQGPAPISQHLAMTPVAVSGTTAAAIGATEITVTLGAAAVTAGQYAGGRLIVQTTPGLGFAYPIDGHPAADSGATLKLKLGLAVQVAITTTSRIDLAPNGHVGVIQAPITTATAEGVGGCVYPIAAGEWGWIQTGGDGAALITGTPAVGSLLTCTGAAAGALAIFSGTLDAVAVAKVVGVDGKVKSVKWIID